MQVELKLFAALREDLGGSQETREVPADVRTVGDARHFLGKAREKNRALPRVAEVIEAQFDGLGQAQGSPQKAGRRLWMATPGTVRSPPPC